LSSSATSFIQLIARQRITHGLKAGSSSETLSPGDRVEFGDNECEIIVDHLSKDQVTPQEPTRSLCLEGNLNLQLWRRTLDDSYNLTNTERKIILPSVG
jgi:hypothetical protein